MNNSHICSKLCLGTWSFGGNKNTYWGSQEKSDVEALVSYAIETNYGFFDTAPIYNEGSCEIALGNALSGHDREKYAVNTKIIFEENTNIEKELEGSLKRLNLDYVDLYMIHWPPSSLKKDVRSIVDKFEQLKARGLFREYAVSNFGVSQLKCILKEGFKPFANELPYSIASRAIEYEVADLCKTHNINIMAYMVLLQGILTGKYECIEDIPKNRRRTRHFHHSRSEIRHGEDGTETELYNLLKILKECANICNISMGLLATSWCLKHPAISTLIVGVRKLEQLKQSIEAVEFKIPDDIYQKISDASEPIKKLLGHNVDLWQSKDNQRTF